MSWTNSTVGAVAESMSTGPFGSAVSSKHFVETGLPMIRGSNLSDNVGVRLDTSDFVYLPAEMRDRFKRSIARPNDLVFTCWGTVGQIGYISRSSLFAEYLVSNKQMKITTNAKFVDALFLYYFLSQRTMIDFVRGEAIGSSVPGFNLGQLKTVPIRYPSLPEQQAIAEVLGALDDKIAANTRLATLAEQMLRAEIDLKWLKHADRSASLSDFVELNPTTRLPVTGEEAAYIDMRKLPDAGWSIAGVDRRVAKGGARFKNGDTLLARITPCLENRKTGYVDVLSDDEVAVGSTEFIVLRSRDGAARPISFLLATESRFREHAIQHMAGTSGRQRVAASDLNDFALPTPDASWLQDFGTRASATFAAVQANSIENRTLAATRDALLPKLMSGQLRVTDAVKITEDAGA